jgi:hypothetical protein
MSDCPAECRDLARFDHVNLWMPTTVGDDGSERAFILYHPYLKQVDERLHTYAQAHGLEVSVNQQGDDWYGSGTLPIRLSISHDSVLWPTERDAADLLSKASFWWIEEEENVPEE